MVHPFDREMDRKLKRGLADLSHFFSAPTCGSRARLDASRFTVESPQDPSPPPVIPRIVGATFLVFSGPFQVKDLLSLANLLKGPFREVCVLAIRPGAPGPELSGHPLGFLQEERDMGREAVVHFRRLAERISFGEISPAQFGVLLQPRATHAQGAGAQSSEKMLLLLDAGSSAGFTGAQDGPFLEIVDHAVFVVRSDQFQLTGIYEWIGLVLSRNRAINCSLMFTGRRAGAIAEFVHERLSRVVSQGLGSDLGLLGWIDASGSKLNLDLLLEEGANLTQSWAKTPLATMLSSSRSSSAS